MRSNVAALYVDPRGPYPKLVEHWYDEARDARTYAGPWPIVAHPPCGPWGRLYRFCTKQPAECGPIAVAQVRRFGGVLEHPADSALWPAAEMSRPGRGPDAHGGLTYPVNQVSWGHPCRKSTWLYVVGVRPMRVIGSLREGGTPTHCIASSRPAGSGLPELSRKWERAITPVAFAEWLLELAASARRP